jgi:hypothetical protein
MKLAIPMLTIMSAIWKRRVRERQRQPIAGVITETINNAQNLGLIAKIPLLTLNAVSRKVDEVLLPMVVKGYSAPTPSLIYVEGNKTTQ